MNSGVHRMLCEPLSGAHLGDLWMWLQLMRLHFEVVVRGPVGVIWGRFCAESGPVGPQTGPTSTSIDPDRTTGNFKLQPHQV